MKRLLLILFCVALPLGIADAGVTKFKFSVEYPDGTTGVITAGVRVTKRSSVAVCSYFSGGSDGSGDYLGEYEERNGFASDDLYLVEEFCLDHFFDRM